MSHSRTTLTKSEAEIVKSALFREQERLEYDIRMKARHSRNKINKSTMHESNREEELALLKRNTQTLLEQDKMTFNVIGQVIKNITGEI